MTPRARQVLGMLVNWPEGGDPFGYEAEIVRDGTRSGYLSLERIQGRTVDQLIQCCAVSDLDVGLKAERLVVNETGRAIWRRPALEDEVRLAVLSGRPVRIVDDRLVDA